MEAFSVIETDSQVKSPFQLLTSFGEHDIDKFFGRDDETRILYQFIQESNVVLVYGESGTGKTSLVRCGLVNETKHFNWTTVAVRRIEDINTSLRKELQNHFDTRNVNVNELDVTGLMRKVFLTNFQPILFIFDQFEELFNFGTEEERKQFLLTLKEIFSISHPWKIIFVVREDRVGRLDELEEELPKLFSKRFRINLMNKAKCREVIIKSCDKFDILLTPLKSKSTGTTDIVDDIFNALANKDGLVHPPYLQVFLDTLWKEARSRNAEEIIIDASVVEKVGSIGNVLKAFVEEKVNEQQILGKVDVWKFLKLFVPEKGTTRNKVKLDEYTAIPAEKLEELVAYLIDNKILSGCSVNNYELAHESLVPIIQKNKITEFRSRLTTPTITGNPFKGLQSFDPDDDYRFFGRREAIQTVYEKITQQSLLVVVGNSGAGKSSLIKAGLFPILKKQGYKILTIVRAGEQPIRSIEEAVMEIEDQGDNKFVLLIDQYEELITRINEKEVRQAVYDKLYELLEDQTHGTAGYILKVILTVRADFEPQFRMAKPLSEYWKQGKYIVPPFSREEIREVIEEPAYQAGLEFSPPSLVDTIAEEVYGSQATGLLPLMSFTLSELYKSYEKSGCQDNLLTEEDYYRLGGVFGGLQNRADHLYQALKNDHPYSYEMYQGMMQNIILRMVYLSTGELAGQRVLKEDLIFNDVETNAIAEEVSAKLEESHLVVSGVDNRDREYFEPAHDVLVRTWGQIWEWIGKIGKDAFFLRSRLGLAVNDYHQNNKENTFLWDRNPWLNNLLPQLNEPGCWLNKKEFEFVQLSKKEKDKTYELLDKEREEKIRLIQERAFAEERNVLIAEKYKQEEEKNKAMEARFLMEQERNKLVEEIVEAQKRTIIKIRKFRSLLMTALITAAFFGIVAVIQRQRAVGNFEHAEAQRVKVLSLNNILEQNNDLLRLSKDSIFKLVILEKYSALKAKASADTANGERTKALKLVEELDKEIKIREAAERLAKNRGDSLGRAAIILKGAYDQVNMLNEILASKNNTLDSINQTLKIQNVSQILAISRKLEQEDRVKAYRIAELAYKRDSSNREVLAQFRRLANTSDYYYMKELDGTYSTFSPNGKLFLTYSSLQKRAALHSATDKFNIISTINVKPDLQSLTFSPDGQFIFATYKNEVQVFALNSMRYINNFIAKGNSIISTTFSTNSKEQKALLLTENGLFIWQPGFLKDPIRLVSNKAMEKMASAFFTEDGARILCGGESGAVYIVDARTGSLISSVADRNIENSFISPTGNYFIIGASKNTSVYNSFGKSVKVSGINKYGILNSAIFSEDGQKVLLTLTQGSIRQQQQQVQQKSDVAYSKTSYVLVNINTGKTSDLEDFMTMGDVAVLPDGSPNVLIKENRLLVAQGNGLVRSLNLETGESKSLTGHNRAVRSMSLSNTTGYILTSAANNSTKIWKYLMPGQLDKLGLLPELTADELKKYGEDK